MSNRPDVPSLAPSTTGTAKFRICNPEALFRPEVARAVVQLIRAPAREQAKAAPAEPPLLA